MTLDEIRGRAVITIPEAGELLGNLPRSTAYDAARRGEIPTIEVGRRHLVPVPAFLRLLGAEPESESETSAADPDTPERRRPDA